MDYLPIVDISRHQGNVDFRVMKAKGVHGLILRICNGDRLDDRAADYYTGAVAAGFDPADVLWYPFVNPKRCYPNAMVDTLVDNIRSITGRDDAAVMWDCEWFDREYGTQGPGLIRGDAYAGYMRNARRRLAVRAPGWRDFGYASSAFWDSWVGTHGDDIVNAIDWLVPRYPVYSLPGYARYPVPGVDGWAEWAFARASSGPRPPRGTDWAGWQFSAGYNRQGPVYGCQSSDLDLNIVKPDAWARWTGRSTPDVGIPAVQPPEETEVVYLINPANPVFQGGLFTPDGHPASPELRDAVLAAGGKIVDQNHAHWDAATLHKMGPDARKLYDPTYKPPVPPKAPSAAAIATELAKRLAE